MFIVKQDSIFHDSLGTSLGALDFILNIQYNIVNLIFGYIDKSLLHDGESKNKYYNH